MSLCAKQRLWGVLIGLGICAQSACERPKPSNNLTQLQALQDKIIAQDRTIAERNQQLAEQTKVVQELRDLKGNRSLDKLIHVTRIEIERLSGGYDDDQNGVPDGVVIYLSLLDQDGDACKATGTASVRVVDLSAKGGPTTVAEATFTPDQMRSHWYGRFMTQHYTLRVPWRPEDKAHPPTKAAAVVHFTDLLTGQSFDADQSLDLAISGSAPTQPAP